MLSTSQASPSILLANEPLAYRQALSCALQIARPHLQVLAVAPDELDAAVQDHAPLLVICDRLTQLVEQCVAAWVLLYPGGTRNVTSSLAGEEERASDLDLAGLLAFVDRAGARTAP
jgi:hypothetical protein